MRRAAAAWLLSSPQQQVVGSACFPSIISAPLYEAQFAVCVPVSLPTCQSPAPSALACAWHNSCGAVLQLIVPADEEAVQGSKWGLAADGCAEAGCCWPVAVPCH